MRALEEALLEQEACLQAAAKATAEMDAALSLATVAADFGFIRPQVLPQTIPGSPRRAAPCHLPPVQNLRKQRVVGFPTSPPPPYNSALSPTASATPSSFDE